MFLFLSFFFYLVLYLKAAWRKSVSALLRKGFIQGRLEQEIVGMAVTYMAVTYDWAGGEDRLSILFNAELSVYTDCTVICRLYEGRQFSSGS